MWTACGPFPKAETEYLENPERTMQEIQEHWQVNKEKYCASVAVPDAIASQAVRAMDICLEPYGRFTKSEAEQCMAEWKSGALTASRRNHKQKHHHHNPHAHI
jgi:hypothetical protein